MAAQRTSQRNVEMVRAILGSWAAGNFSVFSWADTDIDYCGPDLCVARGIAAMASQWHNWLSSTDHLAIKPERFIGAGPDQVLVLARFSRGSEEQGAPIAEFAGVCLFVLEKMQVVRLSLFVDNTSGTGEGG